MSEVLGITANIDELPCKDTECDGTAELEQDGGYAYYECDTCGFIFGHKKLESPTLNDSCAIGVPEDVRRTASTPMEVAQAQDEARKNFAAKWLGMRRPDGEEV